MTMRLGGDVAAVVGGARGMGLAISRALLAEGARVAIIDRDPATAELAGALSAEFMASREEPGRCLGLAADVSDFAAIQTTAEAVWRALGKCDHVVFAAGVGSGKFGFPFWNLEPADWEPVIRVNLLGAVHVGHAFAPRLAQAGRGTILFLASVAGQIGSQTDPPYSASKAALINFAQCAAKDLAPFGVRVNTINPGMVKTTLNRSVYEAWAARQRTQTAAPAQPTLPDYETWAAEKIQKLVPLNRWQEAEDVAAMAVFLASDQARNITGQTINVDGGYVMHW